MSDIRICNHCQGFIPAKRDSCPNCATEKFSIPGPLKGAFTLVAGSIMAVTLSACYGSPCAGGAACQPEPIPPSPCNPVVPDSDGDGFCADRDCDDRNPAIFPGAWDMPDDGIDQNCDGEDSTEADDEDMTVPPENVEYESPDAGAGEL